MLSLTEALTKRHAVTLGGPIAVSAVAIWASESFTIKVIIGNIYWPSSEGLMPRSFIGLDF